MHKILWSLIFWGNWIFLGNEKSKEVLHKRKLKCFEQCLIELQQNSILRNGLIATFCIVITQPFDFLIIDFRWKLVCKELIHHVTFQILSAFDFLGYISKWRHLFVKAKRQFNPRFMKVVTCVRITLYNLRVICYWMSKLELYIFMPRVSIFQHEVFANHFSKTLLKGTTSFA